MRADYVYFRGQSDFSGIHHASLYLLINLGHEWNEMGEESLAAARRLMLQEIVELDLKLSFGEDISAIE